MALELMGLKKVSCSLFLLIFVQHPLLFLILFLLDCHEREERHYNETALCTNRTDYGNGQNLVVGQSKASG